jgi:uncharacterized protein (DUF983 family)
MYLPDNHPLKDFIGFFIASIIGLACVGLLLLPTLFLKPGTWAGGIYGIFLLIVMFAMLMTCLKHMFDND